MNFIVIFSISLFYIVIFIRLIDMGMAIDRAIIRSIKFPYKIIKIHINLFKNNKNQSNLNRLRMLLFPILKLPDAIIAYGNMYIQGDIFVKALNELTEELDNEDMLKIISILEKKGIIKEVEINQRDGEIHLPNVNTKGFKYNYTNTNATV